MYKCIYLKVYIYLLCGKIILYVNYLYKSPPSYEETSYKYNINHEKDK